jgi:UDP-N-acetylmuramyl pentapeptide phosphotransferase/UDP-N-acetylglucosamine-1-phosphate transferase
MTNPDVAHDVAALALVFVIAAAISAGLVLLLHPILVRYALARPNARSSHRTPTPQGGGIAVIGAVTIAIGATAALSPDMLDDAARLAVVFASVIGLAILGAIDDIHTLEALPRLFLQTAAVAIVIATLPAEMRIVPILPWWLERAGLLIGVVWFVNLVNFMDGLDWMTVAEVVSVTAALALFGVMGALPKEATLVALALCGATIGFAPFNRPVARLFLGDVGSLPIGLLLGWMLILLAGQGHLAAALLLPLYYVADATITLLRRLVSGERVMEAHRSHFYQRALDSGLSVNRIIGCVVGLNIILLALAAMTLMSTSPTLQVLELVTGCVSVGALLWNFSNARR